MREKGGIFGGWNLHDVYILLFLTLGGGGGGHYASQKCF